jgi:hypothetical protein
MEFRARNGCSWCGFVYLLIAHPKAPLWPVGSECTFPAPSTMSRHYNGIQRTICASETNTLLSVKRSNGKLIDLR